MTRMNRLTPADFDALYARLPNARIEADEEADLQYLVVGRKTVAVTALGSVEADVAVGS